MGIAMAHGFTDTDNMVIVGTPAWHGLGRVVDNAPTPAEALKLAKLDWTVEQWPMVAVNEPSLRMPVTSHVCNMRSDTGEQLGVVGQGYRPIQNAELAQFATALGVDSSGESTVKVESAASICGGRRVWFLLRANTFSVKGFNDEVTPYLLLANGHDGSLAFHARPTSVRVVCKNTLSMSMGSKSTCFDLRFKHEGDIQGKLEETRRVLGLFSKTADQFREKVDYLSSQTVTKEQLAAYFVDAYSAAFKPIPANPTTTTDRKAATEACETIYHWTRAFDRDSQRFGATRWIALNAVTDCLQHLDVVRGRDDRSRNENRLKSQLFGAIEERTNAVAKVALTLAG